MLRLVSVFHRQHFKEHFITEICIHVIHRKKSQTSTSEVADESVTENGVDQIVAEAKQQSHIDAVEPCSVITESEDDNVEAVPDNNEIDASLSGQSDDLSPEGSANKGYALLIFKSRLPQ